MFVLKRLLLLLPLLLPGQTFAQAVGVIGADTSVNYPPVANPQEVINLENTAVLIFLTGDDANRDPLTFSIVNRPSNGILTGFDAVRGAVTYSPASGFFGTDAFTFKVNDGIADSAPMTVTIAVGPVNDPPTLVAIGSQLVSEGGMLGFTVAGSDPEGNPLTYSASGLPPGAIFDPITHKFSWTPGFDQAGTYEVTFHVSDGNLFASETITITVDPAPVVVSVIFVEPTGICGGQSPCVASLQQAINVATTDTVIKVAQGSYRENISINAPKNLSFEGGWSTNFTARANHPGLTIIDGDVTGDGLGEGGVLSIEASTGGTKVSIDRFTIQNGSDQNGGGIFASAFNTGLVELSLTGNIIRNNKAINSGGGVGLYAQDSGAAVQAVLTNNMIYGNDTAGDGAGIYAFAENGAGVSATFISNTVSDNAASEIGGGLRAYASGGGVADVTVKNSIIWGNTATDGHDIALRNALGGSAIVNASYSDLGDVWPDADAPGTLNDLGNNIDADPLFVDLSGGDLRLVTGSPAINAGTNNGVPTDDFEGQARPQGTANDIGADEWYGPLVPNVVGQTQAVASSAITAAGLVVGTVTLESSATVPGGNVISQNPSAGTSVAAGSAVNLVVSSRAVPGDVNGDLLVSCADVSIVKASFGRRVGQPGYDSRADINKDGVVDIRDLAFVTQRLPAGTTCN